MALGDATGDNMLRRLFAGEKNRAASHEDLVRAEAERLLGEAKAELDRVDTKAQVLLGIAGIGLGAVAAGLLAGSWSPTGLDAWVVWLWGVGGRLTLVAVGAFAGAVYPQVGAPKRDGSLTHFMDIAQYGTAEEVVRRLSHPRAANVTELAGELLRISVLVRRKYRFVRWGCWSLLTGVVLSLGSIITGWLLTV